jgi:hypothetical protein
MKKLILVTTLMIATTAAQAQYLGTGSNPNSHGVQGHITNSGTYVQPHQQTNPNSTQRDNYSATGNVNPYTGAVGTRTPRNRVGGFYGDNADPHLVALWLSPLEASPSRRQLCPHIDCSPRKPAMRADLPAVT